MNPQRLQGVNGNINSEVVFPTLSIEGNNIQSELV